MDEFFRFDEDYVRRLQERDRDTMEHFDAYFRELLRQMFRGRTSSPDDVDDLVQTTFLRVLEKLDQLREAPKLGAFVFSFAQNVLKEHYRAKARNDRNHTDAVPVANDHPSAEDGLIKAQTADRVRKTLDSMPKRDADILRDLFFNDVPKDEICSKHGVDRSYLRVLVHRAIEKFRQLF